MGIFFASASIIEIQASTLSRKTCSFLILPVLVSVSKNLSLVSAGFSHASIPVHMSTAAVNRIFFMMVVLI
jgi:hypothetical protein